MDSTPPVMPGLLLALPPNWLYSHRSVRLGPWLAVTGAGAVVAATIVLLRRWRIRALQTRPAHVEAPTQGCSLNGSNTEDSEGQLRNARPRVGGMKLSRLRRMVEEIAEACFADGLGESRGSCTEEADRGLEGLSCSATKCGDDAMLTWDEQVLAERRAMEAAAGLVRGVRQSAVHRKLPHYHVVDRELATIEHQLENVAMSTQGFWRYGRDQPMQELFKLPFVHLASTGGEDALLPVTLGFVKHTSDAGLESVGGDSQAEISPGEDAALLGVALSADREAIESAYRRRSRHFHRCGRCSNVAGFNALTAARNRCLARLAAPSLRAYGGGGDLLAHYLLIGTDPSESRYREFSHGILDSMHRRQILEKIQVLQWPTWDIPLTWGDDDDMIGFGGANHMGASG